jgi:hypothetical protein
MYCTFVRFVNQHFPGLPSSLTHCIISFLLSHCTYSIWTVISCFIEHYLIRPWVHPHDFQHKTKLHGL